MYTVSDYFDSFLKCFSTAITIADGRKPQKSLELEQYIKPR